MKFSIRIAVISLLCVYAVLPAKGHTTQIANATVKAAVTQAVTPVMQKYGVPGMAVGVVLNGHEYVYDYGVASRATGQPVTANTLFEIGSISKTFNATLAAYAQSKGDLSLSRMASQYMPELRGTAFDKISLADLGTYTPGGMPLQVPDEIDNHTKLIAYLKAWKPAYKPGTTRTYSNLSIGLLGLITAKTMHADYGWLLQNQMFPALGLKHSFISVPASEAANYAEGYEDDGTPIRLHEGVLTPEAAGLRTTAGDLLRFLAINMQLIRVDPTWQRAAMATHTGYDQTNMGGMVQDLVWEQYNLPISLAALEAGNSYSMILDPHPVSAISPSAPPRADVLLDKTGSTNGFGAYVAFIPADRLGIVLLANKAYPIPARVSAAYEILTRLNVIVTKG